LGGGVGRETERSGGGYDADKRGEDGGGVEREREMRSDAATAMDDMHPPPHK
jgi:hypothetical protein